MAKNITPGIKLSKNLTSSVMKTLSNIKKQSEELLQSYIHELEFDIVHRDKTYVAKFCENDVKVMMKNLGKTATIKLEETDKYLDYVVELIAHGDSEDFSVFDEEQQIICLDFPFASYRFEQCSIYPSNGDTMAYMTCEKVSLNYEYYATYQPPVKNKPIFTNGRHYYVKKPIIYPVITT